MDSFRDDETLKALFQGTIEPSDSLEKLEKHIDTRDRSDQTLLHHAVDEENIRLVGTLLTVDQDLDAGDQHDYTAIHRACQLGNLEMLQMLLEAGADPQICDEEEYDGLHAALLYEPVEVEDKSRRLMVEALLKHNVDRDWNLQGGDYFPKAFSSQSEVVVLDLLLDRIVRHKANLEYLVRLAVKLDDLSSTKYLFDNYGEFFDDYLVDGCVEKDNLLSRKADYERKESEDEMDIDQDGARSQTTDESDSVSHHTSEDEVYTTEDESQVYTTEDESHTSEDEEGSTHAQFDHGRETKDDLEIEDEDEALLEKSLMQLAIENDNSEMLIYLVKRLKNRRRSSNLFRDLLQDNELNLLRALLGTEYAFMKNEHNETVLHDAALRSHHLIALECLKRGVDKGANDVGKTPLQVAIEQGDLDMCRILSEHRSGMFDALLAHYAGMMDEETENCSVFDQWNQQGFEVDQFDLEEQSFLTHAVKSGKEKFIELLIRLGAKANSIDRIGMTALQYAVKNRDAKIVKLLLSHGAKVEVKDAKGDPLPHLAVHGDDEVGIKTILRVLIGAKININEPNADGVTILMYAARACNESLVQFLLRHDADVFVRDHQENGLVHFAALGDNEEIAKRITRLMMEEGACIDAPGPGRPGPIFCAAQTGKWDLFEYLLDCGAQTDGKDTQQANLMHYVASSGEINLLKRMVSKHGHDPENIFSDRDHIGRLPLHCAIRAENPEVIAYVIEMSQDSINVADRDGLTPLHLAARRLDSIAVLKLLHHGAKVDTQDKRGNTPLHLAASALKKYAKKRTKTAKFGTSDLIHALGKKGANFLALNNKGERPFNVLIDSKWSLSDLMCDGELLYGLQYGDLFTKRLPIHPNPRKRRISEITDGIEDRRVSRRTAPGNELVVDSIMHDVVNTGSDPAL